MTVQPSEFVEEEGILPPMLRPWWAVVRPTEYALDRGIAGGLALIFARSVGSRGKLDRGIWWAWLPGRGFRKLSNGEVHRNALVDGGLLWSIVVVKGLSRRASAFRGLPFMHQP